MSLVAVHRRFGRGARLGTEPGSSAVGVLLQRRLVVTERIVVERELVVEQWRIVVGRFVEWWLVGGFVRGVDAAGDVAAARADIAAARADVSATPAADVAATPPADVTATAATDVTAGDVSTCGRRVRRGGRRIEQLIRQLLGRRTRGWGSPASRDIVEVPS